jgi:hypothetical protein
LGSRVFQFHHKYSYEPRREVARGETNIRKEKESFAILFFPLSLLFFCCKIGETSQKAVYNFIAGLLSVSGKQSNWTFLR